MNRCILIPFRQRCFKNALLSPMTLIALVIKKIRDAVITLINSILEVGRHFKTSIIVTNHLATDRGNTRKILNECHMMCVFPFSGSVHGIKYLLERYGGLDKKDWKDIRKTKSRYAVIFKHYPNIILTEKMIWQPTCEDDE